MTTATKTKDQPGTVTINVTVANGQGRADDCEAFRGDAIVWTIDGDLDPGDEIAIGPFITEGGVGSPMTKPDNQRTRKGKGDVDDNVRVDAHPGRYHYDITINRASGAASVIDPEIQIKP